MWPSELNIMWPSELYVHVLYRVTFRVVCPLSCDLQSQCPLSCDLQSCMPFIMWPSELYVLHVTFRVNVLYHVTFRVNVLYHVTFKVVCPLGHIKLIYRFSSPTAPLEMFIPIVFYLKNEANFDILYTIYCNLGQFTLVICEAYYKKA
jgi:hypothetical protein